MVDDDLDWRGDRVETALKSFGAMLGYADPQASRLTWDQATKKLASGGCAFESMNDSAFGELVADGAQEGEDFGATAFPGTDTSFLAVVDVFVAATKAKNAKNALAFLGDISKPATQLAFNEAKGSVPVVRDVDVSSLTAYQRASSKALWTLPVLLSVAHGEAMSPEFQEGFYDAVSTYVRTRNADAFADDLEDAVSKDKIPNAELLALAAPPRRPIALELRRRAGGSGAPELRREHRMRRGLCGARDACSRRASEPRSLADQNNRRVRSGRVVPGLAQQPMRCSCRLRHGTERARRSRSSPRQPAVGSADARRDSSSDARRKHRKRGGHATSSASRDDRARGPHGVSGGIGGWSPLGPMRRMRI